MSDEEQKREHICYEQNYAWARSLNAQMNQVPVWAMTLTGGLWFGAGATENLPVEIRFLLLFFAGLCNLALILAVLRIRDVLESYLEKIKEFHPKSFASGKPANPKLPGLGSYSMISIYCALMLIGGAFSFIVAFWKYWPFDTGLWVGIVVLLAVLMAIYLGRLSGTVLPVAEHAGH